MTRRQVLAASVGVGAAAAGVAAVGVAALPSGPASTARAVNKGLAAAGSSEAMVVYVSTGSTGEMELLVGDRQVTVHDRELVGRLLSAAL